MPATAVLIAVLPASLFLVMLVVFDSFKLVSVRALGRALGFGTLAAFGAVLLHAWLLASTAIDVATLSRDIAPVTEETLKTLALLLVLRRGRAGFLVDAAILGCAVGTGFALIENIEYLVALPDRPLALWFVRGFGTALLHGLATAIVALTAKSLADRDLATGITAYVPGWVAAVAMHMAFNHALVSPFLAAILLVAALPMAAVAVFTWSERATREWVGAGLDVDMELLTLVKSDAFGRSRLGAYLHELKARFPGPVVADMFCLLRLQLELSIRARGMLMAREAGLDLPADHELRAGLQELTYLEHSIGRTGLLALRPLRAVGRRDRWHRFLLQQAGTVQRPAPADQRVTFPVEADKGVR